jgi:hypothetical protein
MRIIRFAKAFLNLYGPRIVGLSTISLIFLIAVGTPALFPSMEPAPLPVKFILIVLGILSIPGIIHWLVTICRNIYDMYQRIIEEAKAIEEEERDD